MSLGTWEGVVVFGVTCQRSLFFLTVQINMIGMSVMMIFVFCQNATVGTTVIRVSAEDPDNGLGGTVSYSMEVGLHKIPSAVGMISYQDFTEDFINTLQLSE